jgi:two-component system OmpR family response regulator
MPSRVLIAEEQEECCQLFGMYLQRCGYEVSTVHDGISCIEAMLDGLEPDVLILSWELPWGEGEGVLDWLQTQGVETMAVIVLTARMDADSYQHESALPRVTWLQRPFRLLELLSAIQTTERVPRNSWRCLEALWRKSARPVHGVLLSSEATTEDEADTLPINKRP